MTYIRLSQWPKSGPVSDLNPLPPNLANTNTSTHFTVVLVDPATLAWAVSHNTLAPARIQRLCILKCRYSQHSHFIHRVLAQTKTPPPQPHPTHTHSQDKVINLLKTACGCPCSRVIKLAIHAIFSPYEMHLSMYNGTLSVFSWEMWQQQLTIATVLSKGVLVDSRNLVSFHFILCWHSTSDGNISHGELLLVSIRKASRNIIQERAAQLKGDPEQKCKLGMQKTPKIWKCFHLIEDLLLRMAVLMVVLCYSWIHSSSVLLYVHRDHSIRTITIRDGEPRIATSTFTQLLSS